MGIRMTRFQLNHNEIDRFMNESASLKELLNKRADDVEDHMQDAILENNYIFETSAKHKKKNVPDFKQEVYKEDADNTDRMGVHVGVDDAAWSDFIYNTPARAAKKAGARKKR